MTFVYKELLVLAALLIRTFPKLTGASVFVENYRITHAHGYRLVEPTQLFTTGSNKWYLSL